MRFFSLTLCAVIIAACGGSPGPNDELIPGEVGLEVGTGEDEFRKIAGGERLNLANAPQAGGGAGSHFWIAVRAQGLDPQAIRVHVIVTRTSDGLKVSDVMRDEHFMPTTGAKIVLTGFRAVVTQCSDVDDEELEVTVHLSDRSGTRATGSAEFLGPRYCPRG